MSEHTLRVLIVDDEESVRERLAERLREVHHYDVNVASNGDEALQLLNKNHERYDVAVIDQILEGDISGLNLLRAIKDRYQEVQVIVFTGWGLKEAEGINILRQGAYRYIAKGNLDELALTIRFAAEEGWTRLERQYMAALVKVGQGLTQTKRQDDQLALAWEFVSEKLDVSTFFIGLTTSDKKGIFFPLVYDEGRQTALDDTILGKKRREWGLAGYVVKTGEEILWSSQEELEQIRKAKKVFPIFVGKIPASGFCVPLQIGEQIQGVLSAQSYQAHVFTPILQNALRALSSQLSVALENSRLFVEAEQKAKDIERQANSLSALQGLALTINSSLKLDDILTKACQIATEFFHADHSGLVLFDPDFIQGTVEAEYPNLNVSGKKIPLRGIPAEEKLIKTRKPLVVYDVQSEESLRAVRDILIDLKVKSILFVPVIGREGLIGSFSLDAIKNQRNFTEEEVALCKTFANQVVVAIENARLFEAESRHRREAETLREAALALTTTMEQGEIFERILRELQKVVPYDSASVQLLKDSMLEIIGGHGFPNLPELLGFSFPLDGDNPNRGVVLRRAPFIVPDAPAVYEGFTKEPHIQAGIRSWLGVPMLIGDCLIGMIAIDKREPYFYTEEHARLAKAFASQAAIAIENARLFTQNNETTEQLDALIENSFDAVIFIGLDRKIKIFNRRAVEVFGWQSEEILGHTVARLYVDVEKARDIFDVVSRLGTVTGRNVELKHRDGTQIPALLSAVLIRDSRGNPIGQVGFIRDLREVKLREQLLIALDEASRHIRAEKEPARLLDEVVLQAAQLVGCTAGGLCINYPHLEELEISVIFGFLPELKGHRLTYKEDTIGSTARTGKFRVVNEYAKFPGREPIFRTQGVQAIVSIPLKRGGEVDAVLFVADTTGSRQFTKTDLEILERFAAQASIVLQTSRLMGQEQRMFARLAVLHRISDYIQDAKDLDKILQVVLTVVTADYGLGFNRAALFLLDQTQTCLSGQMGIGYLNEQDAYKGWAHYYQHGLDDFERYLEWLEQGTLPRMPVGERIHGLHIPLGSSDSNAFTRAIEEQHRILVTADEFDKLPESFVAAFEPALPLTVVPLVVRDHALGLMVADNKFTQLPFSNEDIELLMTFANTAAIAIDNARLFREVEVAGEKISLSFKASGALVSSQGTEQVLNAIVEQAHVATGANWVSLILVDQMGQVRDLITTKKGSQQIHLDRLIREDGISMEVMRTGKPVVIGNVRKQEERVNPRLLQLEVNSALCMPLPLQGKRIGVMWVHYDEVHYFPDYEIEAMQLYVNQAAIAYDSARRMEELEHLRQAVEALSGAAELNEVLQRIVNSAKDVLGADSVAIRSFDASQDEFIPEGSISINIPKQLWKEFQKEEPRKEGTARTIMNMGWIGVVDVSDKHKYPYIGIRTKELLNKIKAKSFQGVALTVGDEKLGVLYLNYKQKRGFGEEEQEIARTFSKHAALALKKTRLLDELGSALKQVTRARNAAQVVAEVTALEELHDTLDSIVKGTQSALECDVVTLYTYNEERDEFGFPPITVGVRDEAKVLEFGSVARDSVPYKVVKLDDIYVAEDSASDLLMGSPFSSREGVKSTIGVPLIARNRKVGVLFVNYRNYHSFTKEELVNIRLFAHQAAVAIRNAQLYDQEQKRTVALEALHEAGKAVNSLLTLSEILERIAEQAWHLVGRCANYTSIRLVENEIAKLVAAYPPEELGHRLATIPEIDLRIGVNGRFGVTGRAIRTGNPQLVDDVSIDYDYLSSQPDARSELAIPIKLGERIIGVINAESLELAAFDEDDERTLISLAGFAAIAINNAQLHERTKGQAEILGGLYEASKAITSTLALKETLQRIVERALYIVKPTYEQEDNFGHVALIENNKLQFIASSPPEILTELQQIEIDFDNSEKIGVTGRAALSGESQNVADVELDLEYIALKESTKSQMSVPLKIGRQITGVLSIEHPEKNAFGEEDQYTLEALASQAAVAIENARLYEAEQRHVKALEAIQTTSAAVSAVLELDILLPMITERAAEIFTAPATSLMLWDKQRENLVIRAAFGLHDEYQQGQRISRTTLDKIVVERGLKPQVFDIRNEPIGDPKLVEREDLYTVLVAPLTIGGELIGVLNIYSKNAPRRFEENEKELAAIFANHAIIAIQNAQSYKELRQTKGLVGSRTALAWMGMVNSTWRHTIEKHAITIRDEVELCRSDLEQMSTTEMLFERLGKIERLANQIREKPITPPLGSEEGVRSVHVNDLIRERVKRLWEDEFYKLVSCDLKLDLDDSITVRVSSEWLQRAFDILMDNAVEATEGQSDRLVTVITQHVVDRVHIIVRDNGKGIMPARLLQLFQEPIEKTQGEKGLGMGLLFAQLIVQTYGGDVSVGSPGPRDTTMIIALPIETLFGRLSNYE